MPKVHRTFGLANFAAALGIGVAAFFVSPWLFFLGFAPFCFPIRYHVCPACGLRLD